MASPTKAPSARQFFSRHGVLSKWHPKYEHRAGQLEMAEAVESALADKRHLIVEAGTGTGKTLAYLIPAILSGKRVVISTGTKNLQEQLFYKDIPFLQQHMEKPLRVCYMKGRGNFACRAKIYEADKTPMLSGLEEIADFQVIRDWERSTITVTGPRLRPCRREARPGASWMRGAISARVRNASSSSAASSPRCTSGRQRAT
jgi:Rad3-related DNA helicases